MPPVSRPGGDRHFRQGSQKTTASRGLKEHEPETDIEGKPKSQQEKDEG